jgi:O-6-methylguanine DNA methyltransferase
MGRIVKSTEVRARFTQYAVPDWGVGELWTNDDVVLAHEFSFGARPPEGAQSPPTGTVPAKPERMGNGSVPSSRQSRDSAGGVRVRREAHVDPDRLVERFRMFFAGGDAGFGDIPIDLDWATAFQRDVALALRAVPRGEVVSYGELAALAGYPGAARAAGTFCAHNRFMLVVPCHRVVGSSGLGGYGSAGVETKRRLLALEGVRV